MLVYFALDPPMSQEKRSIGKLGSEGSGKTEVRKNGKAVSTGEAPLDNWCKFAV
jgi:hypothetical protein